MHPDHFIVCTHLEWVWRDLRAGVAGRFEVTRNRGHDVPQVPDGTVGWWVATAQAARLRQAGLHLPLASVGPDWLAEVDAELTGRRVHATTLAQLRSGPRAAGFLKPAEAKVDQLPAAWVDDLAAAADDAVRAGVHPDCRVQFTTTHLQLDAEYRVFVRDGQPVSTTAYRDAAATPWDETYDTRPDLPHGDARRFAAELVAELVDDTPPAWVCDIARTASGRWLLLEANAAWSSGTYGADLTEVVDCAVAASTGDPGHFAWQPDPHELAAARRNPLRQGA